MEGLRIVLLNSECLWGSNTSGAVYMKTVQNSFAHWSKATAKRCIRADFELTGAMQRQDPSRPEPCRGRIRADQSHAEAGSELTRAMQRQDPS